MTLTKDEAATRVARGAVHLDRARPDWFVRIDVTILAMERCDRCILGQAYGEYIDALGAFEWLPLSDDGDVALAANTPQVMEGFTLPSWADGTDENWGLLEDAWIAAMAARKFPDVPNERSEDARALVAVDPGIGVTTA